MYKIKFKFIALILALSLISTIGLQTNQIALAEDIVLAEEEINDEYLALKGMGFIEENFDALEFNNGITRAQFMGILYNMAGLNKVAYSSLDMPFIDVNENTPYKDAIYNLYKLGYVNGSSDNLFLPNNAIKHVEAMKVIIDVLGYRPYIYASSSNYPSNYENVARTLDLISAIDYSREKVLTVKEAMVLLYEAGKTNTMDVSGVKNENPIYYTSFYTLLSRSNKIYYGKGVMNSNGIASLIKESSDNGMAVIGNILFKNEHLDLTGYLGFEVEYFYKDSDGEKSLVWVTKTNNFKSLLIKYDDLEIDHRGYGFDKIYYSENNKEKSANIDSFASIVYNNSLYNDATINKLKPKSGTIQLIDNDRDNKYDVVIITEYSNIFVEAVSPVGEFIADKYGNTINLSKYNDYKIFKDNKIISLVECPTNVVVSYVETRDQKNIYMYVNDIGTTATLDSISEKDDEMYYTFSDKVFKLSDSYKALILGDHQTVTLKVGNIYKYYLDIDGNIAELTDEVDKQSMYAYVIDARANTEIFTSKRVALFKILSETGEIIIAKTAEKIKIDDDYNKTGRDILNDSRLYENGVIKEQVVVLKFNKDGEICEFDFADELPSDGFPYDSTKFTKDFSTTTGFYNKDLCEMINYKYYVGQSTICFVKYINVDLKNDYRVVKRDQIAERRDYTVSVYDCDETMKAGAITLEIDGVQTLADGHVLVDEVRYIHENEETRLQITGYTKAKKVVYTELSENLVTRDIKRGDILRVSLVDGKLSSVYNVCRLTDKPEPFINMKNSNAQPGGDEFTQIFGYLYSKGENTLVTLNPENSPFGKLSVTSFKGSLTIPIMIYDNRTDTVYMGSLNDLYQIATPDSEGNLYINENSVRVFIYRRYNYAQEIIVVYY